MSTCGCFRQITVHRSTPQTASRFARLEWSAWSPDFLRCLRIPHHINNASSLGFSLLASVRAFYQMRFARIAPLLLALLAILSALHFAHVRHFIVPQTTGGLGRALVAALTFHINVLEARRGYLPGNWDILWSLSVEEMFYLFFPLILWCAAVENCLLRRPSPSWCLVQQAGRLFMGMRYGTNIPISEAWMRSLSAASPHSSSRSTVFHALPFWLSPALAQLSWYSAWAFPSRWTPGGSQATDWI